MLAVARLSVVLYCGLYSLEQGVCRVQPTRLLYSDIGRKTSPLSHTDTMAMQ